MDDDRRDDPPDRLAAWVAARTCCCPHPDPRACLMMRAAPGPEHDPPPGERCDCRCHDRSEDDDGDE